jgi:hypothetical protein
MKRYVAICVLLISFGCSRGREVRIDTPEGQVIAHNTQVEATPQTITVIQGDELARLQSLGKDGPDFVAHYFPNTTQPGLKDYDAAFRAWQLDKTPKHTEQQVIDIIGGYLGNKCIADFEMEWVTVTDEFGTEYAVQSTKVELMSYPFSTVRKRIEDKKYDFVQGVYYTIKEVLDSGESRDRQPTP